MQKQDIITCTVHAFWAWIESIPLEMGSLFVRWGIVLLLLLIGGIVVRTAVAPRFRSTLPAQVMAFLLALSLGLSVSLDGLAALSLEGRARLVSLAMLAWPGST